MFSFLSFFLLFFLEEDLLECFSSLFSSLFFVSAIESIISRSELPCCIIVGTGSWCWDALDFFFSARCLLFILCPLSEPFLPLFCRNFSPLWFFSEDWIRSGTMYWETSICVLPVDSERVNVSSWKQGLILFEIKCATPVYFRAFFEWFLMEI